MILKKLIFVLFFSCGLFSTAQNRLDDIYLNLPKEYNWEKQPVRFQQDSTMRIQSYLVNKKNGKPKMRIFISSTDKREVEEDFKGIKTLFLENIKKGENPILLDERKIEGKYPFVFYKVIRQKKEKGKPGSFMTVFYETKNTFHIVMLLFSELNMSKDIIAEWQKTFLNPVIEP